MMVGEGDKVHTEWSRRRPTPVCPPDAHPIDRQRGGSPPHHPPQPPQPPPPPPPPPSRHCSPLGRCSGTMKPADWISSLPFSNVSSTCTSFHTFLLQLENTCLFLDFVVFQSFSPKVLLFSWKKEKKESIIDCSCASQTSRVCNSFSLFLCCYSQNVWNGSSSLPMTACVTLHYPLNSRRRLPSGFCGCFNPWIVNDQGQRGNWRRTINILLHHRRIPSKNSFRGTTMFQKIQQHKTRTSRRSWHLAGKVSKLYSFCRLGGVIQNHTTYYLNPKDSLVHWKRGKLCSWELAIEAEPISADP